MINEKNIPLTNEEEVIPEKYRCSVSVHPLPVLSDYGSLEFIIFLSRAGRKKTLSVLYVSFQRWII
mgnify:CR=1 FL=1